MSTEGNFLLPDVTLVIECAVFLIVLWALSRVALPRLRAAVDARQRQLDEATRTIEQATAVRETADREARTITTAAHRQARSILDRAREEHARLIADGMRKGREEYEWTSQRARREAARSRASAPSQKQPGRPPVATATTEPRS
jgi:F0F1-type ATP synthase membrane subunit b/b'